MEIDMGEVDLVFGFCVYYTKIPSNAGHNSYRGPDILTDLEIILTNLT
jgi:hypothetical protein